MLITYNNIINYYCLYLLKSISILNKACLKPKSFLFSKKCKKRKISKNFTVFFVDLQNDRPSRA